MFVFLFASLGCVLVRRLALKFEIGLDLPEGRPEVAGNGLEPGCRCGGGCVAPGVARDWRDGVVGAGVVLRTGVVDVDGRVPPGRTVGTSGTVLSAAAPCSY